MASRISYLRPWLARGLDVSVSRARLPIPRSVLHQCLRKYSSEGSSFQPTVWTPAKGAPSYIKREDASKALAFAITNEKPYQWGNLLHYFWLRDNCRCSICVNQNTRQRNFNTFELPLDIGPSRMTSNGAGLEIQWSHDSHVSFYRWDFLEPYIKGNRPNPEDVQIKYFGEKGHPDSTIEYGQFRNPEANAVGRLTDMIRRNGFAVVNGVPTESAKPTKDLLEEIGPIRVTHYGDFYDFIPDHALADTAYTNLALPAHTDTTYFTEPAGIQSFHLLSHMGSGPKDGTETSLGGKSLLVDGFHAAQILKAEEPGLFDILASVGVPCHASGNKGIAIAPDKLYPVLDYDAKRNMMHRIRWNNDDRGVVPVGSGFSAMQWYEAAMKWNEILTRKELEYWFQLKPGNVLIFDNWRVLHGRSAFTGIRRICGGYINRDDFISRWRNTNYPTDQVLKQVIG
ncbi:trimethyllysine dioxygenase [Nemania serpens]|nr:trimethyllysine dioxygenase [Nemania serpens]